jgi:hypothetical protein
MKPRSPAPLDRAARPRSTPSGTGAVSLDGLDAEFLFCPHRGEACKIIQEISEARF